MKLTKSEKDELQSYGGKHNLLARPYHDIQSCHLQIARNQLCNLKRDPRAILASNIYFLESRLLGKAVCDRLLNEKVENLSRVSLICSRLKAVKDKVYDTNNSELECIHVWALLFSLAVNDELAVQYYLQEHKPPFKSGHKFAISCASYIHALLKSDTKISPTFQSSTKFEKSVELCIDRIFNMDNYGTQQSLVEVFSNYRRTNFAELIQEKHICFLAIGLMALAKRVNDFTLPENFEAKGFDRDLFNLFSTPIELSDLRDILNPNICRSLWFAINNPRDARHELITQDLESNFDVVDQNELRL